MDKSEPEQRDTFQIGDDCQPKRQTDLDGLVYTPPYWRIFESKNCFNSKDATITLTADGGGPLDLKMGSFYREASLAYISEKY